MHRAASDANETASKHQQPSTDSYNEAGTFTTYATHATWDISETSNEALSSTQHEDHVVVPRYGLTGRIASTASDLASSHAGSPPFHGIVHEALQHPWNTQLSSDYDIPLQPLFNGNGLSSLGDAGLWSLVDAGYADDLFNLPWLDPQTISHLVDTDISLGADYRCSEPQGDAAPDHAIQVTQSSSYSSVSSSLDDQDSPDSTEFSQESSGIYGLECKHPGNEHRRSATCSLDQPRPSHPYKEGNSYTSHNYFPRIASMASKPAPSHPNNPRNRTDNRSTWSANNSQTYTQSMGVNQKQSKDSPNRKRKRSSNRSNAIMSGNSSSAQGNTPMAAMNPQEANPISDTTSAAETLLACHFYKMNPKQHSSCRTKTFQSISSLGQHLRSAHCPKSRHSCESCFQSSQSEAALHAHVDSGVCRPTGGVEIPTVSRKRGTQASKWYTVWSQLFPNLAPPRAPYRDGHHEIDQFVQYCERSLPPSTPELTPEQRRNFASWLRSEALRWRSEPGEPLDHKAVLASSTGT